MKKPAMLLTLLGIYASSANAAVVTFEETNLSPNSNTPISFDGQILSGGASVTHNYTPFFDDTGTLVFEGWDGFSVSNQTDTATPGFGNQYSAIAGGGADGSDNYAVSFCFSCSTFIEFDESVRLQSADFTNTTYAFIEMRDGGSFGGTAFTSGDFLDLQITGLSAANAVTGMQTVSLASGDSILDLWLEVDLSGFGAVKRLQFDVSASQASVPQYFAIDNISYQAVPVPAGIWLFASALMALRLKKVAK